MALISLEHVSKVYPKACAGFKPAQAFLLS